MPPSDAAIIVLAAGRGRRMGGPKALMDVGGQAWWLRQDAALRAVCAALPGFGATWVVNDEVGEAMLGACGARPDRVVVAPGSAEAPPPMWVSLVTGLRSLSTPPSSVFVLPVDVPCCDLETWRSLGDAEGDVCVPVVGGVRGHPVRMAWAWLERHVLPRGDDADARLDHVIRDAGGAREVDVADDAVTWNINTPDELAAWCARTE